jgi:CelD/BcsL family acetyltransferase involved in cellulose biosynthesis
MLEPHGFAGFRPHLVDVEVRDGFPSAIDAAAAAAAPGRRFLRAAWYAAAAEGEGRTIVGRRLDGSIVAALPSQRLGPHFLGARAIPGSYWPFRSAPVSVSATEAELVAMLSEEAALRALGPMWRIGPVYRDDPGAALLARAFRRTGWSLLERRLGITFQLNLAGVAAAGNWPRKSTRRRIALLEKKLAAEGEVAVRFVNGAAWNERTFVELEAVERSSWVASRTDGGGAKFLDAGRRDAWRRMVEDPELAKRLSATILSIGGVPVAFSFDFRCGSTEYGIAGSYDQRFAAFSPGKIVTYRQLEGALVRGVELVDFGAGDSGYKRELGAVAGPEIVDYLFVRSRSAAAVIRPKWEGSLLPPAGRRPARDAPPLWGRNDPIRPSKQVLIAGLTAAAAAALAE